MQIGIENWQIKHQKRNKIMKQVIKKVVKKGFPDVSGDGKITKKDILIAKGVIPKKKK